MRRILAGLILCLLLFPAVTASANFSSLPTSQSTTHALPARPLHFEHLGLEDGLSQSAILASMQDRQGYLWFGTQDGLNRYDGYNFTVYRNDPENENSLNHNSVIALAQSPHDETIWIGTWGGGLNRYDPQTGEFTIFRHDSNDVTSLSDDTVTSLLFSQTGDLWIGTANGLERYTGSGFEHFYSQPGNPQTLSANNIAAIYEDAQGSLWVGTGGLGIPGNGLNRLNADGTFTRYGVSPQQPGGLSSGSVSALWQDEQGVLWVGTGGFNLEGGGLNRLNADGSFTYFRNDGNDPNSLSADNILCIWQEPGGPLWIGTWQGGVNIFDPRHPENGFRRVQHDPLDPDSLSHNSVWSIFADRSGVLWLGTVPGGINKFNPRTAQFALYRHQPGEASSLSHNTIGGFYEDSRGRFWVATWGGGLNQWDRARNEFHAYRSDPSDPHSLPSDTVNHILEDVTGRLWVAHMAGVSHFDPDRGTFDPVLLDADDPQSALTDLTYTMAETPQGIWLGTFNGLQRVDPQTGQVTTYRNDPADAASVSSSACTSLLADSSGTLWVGTWDSGLNRYDGGSNSFRRFQHNPADMRSLSNNAVWVLHEDKQGNLWVGTQAGLNRLDTDGSFTRYRLQDGLPNETIMGIEEDARGRLWISTGNGLVRFDPQEETFKRYDATDGLQSNEFDGGAAYTDRRGVMYFGGVNGFNAFDPLLVDDNTTPPPVAVTTVRVFNEPVQADLSGKSRLEIFHWQNFIAFEFAALDYHAPEKNRYAYKLEGFDLDWVDAGSRRYASYTNLPGGEYTFRVKAANSDGVWNESGASIPLQVIPPFWQTRWFAGGIVLAVLATFGVAYIYRMQAVQAQKRELEFQVTQRTQELRHAQAELARHAAEELSVSQARFQAMFENAAIGIALVGLNWRIIEANEALVQMSGRSCEALMQTSGTELTYAEDRELGHVELDELLAGKRSAFQVEKRYVRPDGYPYWVRQTVSAVRDSSGQVLYLVMMVEDIDQQKRDALALRESEARFRAILDNAAVGVAVTTLDRRIIQINPTAARLTGYTADEMSALNPSLLAMEDDRDADKDWFTELAAGKRNQYLVEKRYVRKDGTFFWGRVNFSLVRGDGGRPLYAIGMIEDITEEKRSAEKLAAQEAEYRRTLEQRVEERTFELAEANIRLLEEIEQRQRVEEALAAKAAEEAVVAERTRLARDLHDAVTQTLFAASLIAEVLPDLWTVDADEAQKSTEELRQLTRGALAEMRTLLLELRPAALTQARLADLLRQLAEALIGRARLPVTLTVEGERSLPPEVQVGLYRIAQESLNNIFKYARATHVEVHLALSPAGANLEIRDNGVGFDAAQVRPASMGQRIMRERAEAIGADLQVSSAPGRGTTVSVTWVEETTEV
ncbi:MAG: two-component regulator propeller domain-containing protein [Chloroflexota bacterium]